MSHLLFFQGNKNNGNDGNEEEYSTHINIDDLFEKKREKDLKILKTFQRILNELFAKLRHITQHNHNCTLYWYKVPMYIIGHPQYNIGTCAAFIMDKLTENKFNVKFYAPNLICISWGHWVPSYVRHEIKKKMNIEIDEFGRQHTNSNDLPIHLKAQATSRNIENDKDDGEGTHTKTEPVMNYDPNDLGIFPKKEPDVSAPPMYRTIDDPVVNASIYDDAFIKKLQKKLS